MGSPKSSALATAPGLAKRAPDKHGPSNELGGGVHAASDRLDVVVGDVRGPLGAVSVAGVAKCHRACEAQSRQYRVLSRVVAAVGVGEVGLNGERLDDVGLQPAYGRQGRAGAPWAKGGCCRQ